VVNGGVGGGCAIVVVAKELTDNMERGIKWCWVTKQPKFFWSLCPFIIYIFFYLSSFFILIF
jgi:hypothetical protein